MLKRSVVPFLLMIIFTFCATDAMASMAQMKVYRKVYPDLKPNCQYCHVEKVPKKDDGKHDLNEYGMKLKELMGDGELTEDMVQSAGKHDEVGE